MPGTAPAYLAQLSKDTRLRPLLAAHGPLQLERKSNVCLRLCASILSQQLSTHVAKVLYGRFLGLFGGAEPSPRQILELSPEILRGIGLSGAKTQYVRNVAEYFLLQGLTDETLHRMTDEAVMEELLPIKGVGRWTVEMLLMFTLAREDVFAVDDLGIQQAMCAMYGIDASDKKAMKAEMLRRARRWAPFRTYACLHLWRYKDAG